MESILTVTMNPALDISTRIDRVVPERKLRCKTPSYEPGGGGINVARAVHKLGGTCQSFYTRGGYQGQMLAAASDHEGLDHHSIQIEERIRESFTVYEESTGQQFCFSAPGPALRESEICPPNGQSRTKSGGGRLPRGRGRAAGPARRL